jgi:valyl-tRNA synthetase
MVQPFPQAGPVDAEPEGDVEWLKRVIQGIRQVRSELDLPPGKMLDIWLQSGTKEDRSRHQRFSHISSHLGRVQSAEWVEEDRDSSECAVALVGDLKILIPLKGLVDVEAELARLNKQIRREESDLNKSVGKLNNKRFVENAPAAVVEQERERLANHQAKVKNLQSQIEQLESMR